MHANAGVFHLDVVQDDSGAAARWLLYKDTLARTLKVATRYMQFREASRSQLHAGIADANARVERAIFNMKRGITARRPGNGDATVCFAECESLNPHDSV
jgi:hypothetical protein